MQATSYNAYHAEAAALLAIGLLGCGGAEGTDPHDMSAEQHDRTAGAEETAANRRGHQLDPSSTSKFLYCNESTPYWTSTAKSTDPHSVDMARHRELAAKHRAASHALRDAEAKACAGVPGDDRDMSPFRHSEDISSVTELTRREQPGNRQPPSRAMIARRSAGGGVRWARPTLIGCESGPVTIRLIVLSHSSRSTSWGCSGPVNSPSMRPGWLAMNVFQSTTTET